jgi:DNA-binding IclR family transcriptional regulator
VKSLVSSVERCMKILEVLAQECFLNAEQISKKTKIPFATVNRFLNTLETMDYIEREKTGGYDKWSLTLKIYVLADSVLSRLDLRAEIKGVLENLAEKTGHFVQLGILHQGEVIFIDLVKPREPLAIYGQVGVKLPINVCAAGLVLAAALKKEELDKLLSDKELPKYTPNTPTDPGNLREILELTSMQGYSIDEEYYAMGIKCIGAPIFDREGKVIAALNITGTVASYPEKEMPFLIEQVKSAGLEASKKMGYIERSNSHVFAPKKRETIHSF